MPYQNVAQGMNRILVKKPVLLYALGECSLERLFDNVFGLL